VQSLAISFDLILDKEIVCLFSWPYNPLWLYFSQPGSGL